MMNIELMKWTPARKQELIDICNDVDRTFFFASSLSSALIAAVASRPSISGIRISIRMAE